MITRSDQFASPASLDGLAASLDRLTPGSERDSAVTDRLVRTIRSFIVPRLTKGFRPLTVVFAGPTGAGKSTLLNSVAGADLSKTGPLRPTTRLPRVYALAGAAGEYSKLDDMTCEVVPGRAPILKSMTLVDSPDIDSTVSEHRALAETLIDNADVVVFVSSALRYADRVPWEILRRARSRGAPIICVLNRIRATSDGVVHDYRRMLSGEGLGETVVAIGEHHLASGASRVPSGSIRRLRRELVARVEMHRLDSEAILRRVVDATCRDAEQIILTARLHAEAAPSQEPAVERAPIFVPTPVLDDFAPGRFPVSRLLEAASRSRLRARWKARRMARDTELVESESTRLVESIVLGLIRLGRESGVEPTPAIYAQVRAAIMGWVTAAVEGLSGVPPRNEPMVALLIRATAATGAIWPEQLLEMTVPRLDHHQIALTCRRQLTTVAGSAVEAVIPDQPDDPVPPVDLLGPVRVAERALGEVIAAIAFADA